MKTAVIPAQITSVEDKVAANLSLKQLILMVIPIITSGFIYFLLPPINQLSIYKLVLSSILIIIFNILAYRIKGRIILDFLVALSRYFLRPRIYVYKKGFSFNLGPLKSNKSSINNPHIVKLNQKPAVNYGNLAKLDSMVEKQKIKVIFKPSRQGGLNATVDQA